MSIISGFNKVKNYVKTTEGYKLLSRWTNSDTVDVGGKTLTEVVNELGTASKKDVAASGNASTTQVVMGNDTRLTDSRKASDVSAWAKASTKPTYTASEVGAYTKTETDTKLNGKANSSHTHGNGDITSLDASKITSGTISIDRLPQGALDRLIKVADDTARFKLTTKDVQLGDSVKVTSTKKMYIVIDETKLSSEAGYEPYTADSAASVPWSGVTGKPSTYTPSSHTHTKSQITDFPTSMPASDVPAWAKASSKPSYTKSEVGLGNVDNTADSAKSVKYATSAGSAPANGGNSATVNGHTVNSDVPANAKFTDTNTWTALKGATTSAAGSAGYAPAPSAGVANRYLRSDCTWSVPPDTNTTYDIFVKSGSGAKSGLVPTPSTTAGTSKFLREDGTWSNPPTAAVMTGATANANGSSGLVPQPVKGDQSWFLRGDGKWAVPSNTWRGISSTYTSKITDAATTSLSQEGAYNLYTELNGNLKDITDVFFTKAVTGTGNNNRLRIYNFPVNENKKHTITIHSGVQYNAITGIYFCRYGIFIFSVNCGSDGLYIASSLKCDWLIKQDGTTLLSTITVENGNILIKSTEWDTGTLILSAQANDAKVTFE